jgi:hypothetical protein
MAHAQLLALLERIRDDAADASACAEARSRLLELPHLELMVEDLFVEAPADDAELLLGILDEGRQDGPGLLAEALEAEGGVPGALLPGFEAPVAAAVADEAGQAPELARGFDPGAVDVAGAIEAAAGRLEVIGPVAITLGLPDEAPLANAVAAFAGSVDVADSVMAALGLERARPAVAPVGPRLVQEDDALPEGWLAGLLDHELPEALHLRAAEQVVRDERAARDLTAFAELGRELREGVLQLAGPSPSLWARVAGEIGLADPEQVAGWQPELLRSAFLAEAGSANVVNAVMAAIEAEQRQAVPRELAEIPAPANNVSWVALSGMLAAAALLLVLVPRLFVAPSEEAFVEAAPEFAAVGEVNVDRLSYGDNASVFVEVPTDGQTPLIIWVDDGVAR